MILKSYIKGIAQIVLAPTVAVLVIWLFFSYVPSLNTINPDIWAMLVIDFVFIAAIVYMIEGILTLRDAANGKVSDTGEIYRIEHYKRGAKKFSMYIHDLCASGTVKVLYQNSVFTVLDVGGVFYLVCPHSSLDEDEPFGVIMTPNEIHTFIEIPKWFNHAASKNKFRVSLKMQEFPTILEKCWELNGRNTPRVVTESFNKKLVFWNNGLKYCIYFMLVLGLLLCKLSA